MMDEAIIFVCGMAAGASIYSYVAWLRNAVGLSQVANVRGSGSVVIQSGVSVTGDLVGGNLIKSTSSADVSNCKHCGAPPNLKRGL